MNQFLRGNYFATRFLEGYNQTAAVECTGLLCISFIHLTGEGKGVGISWTSRINEYLELIARVMLAGDDGGGVEGGWGLIQL